MAEALGEEFDPENLKRWELEIRLPTQRYHRSIEEVLGIPATEIVSARAISKAYRLQQKMAMRHDGEEVPPVKRRAFITGTLAVAGTGALPGLAEAHEGIDAALSGSGDAADITYLESVFERNTGGYRGRDPQRVLGQMQDDLKLLSDVLDRPHTARDRAGLVRTAAGITGLVAIIQHDRGAHQDAGRWFTTAARAAGESGDRHMLAWVLARHAMVGLNYGAPASAARLAARAQRVAGSTPSAAAALASAVSARALAAMGDRENARGAVEKTQDMIERLDSTALADNWFGYPAQKHSVHLSQAYTLLGDTRSALAEQEAALALTDSPSVMTRALLALDLAQCLRIDKDPQGAADMATDVWNELPTGFRTGLVQTRAEALRNALTGRPRAQLTEVLSF
ncbi:transcriptional regulator [Streptomyces iakyrus]|uniref:hypothetical protein n=1 Tax=Streptomyces iakyrus TaxID=68219 RepID=UPI0005253D47|nr:hypothetical protein [Streptomyces iakyrus]